MGRHRRISQYAWALTIGTFIFTAFDERNAEQWLYALGMLAGMCVAQAGQFGRRPRELAIGVVLAVAQTYMLRYVGNFSLGPLDVIILTFYQDWVPIAFVCVFALLTVVWAALDPNFFATAAAFEQEQPVVGMSLRVGVVLLAAGLALAIWRSGTQFARDQLTGMLSRPGAERILDREIARGKRPAVWVCDLDNFRTVNAELGLAAGDQVLKHVARELKRVARALPGHRLCARLGADTFLIASVETPGELMVESFAFTIGREAAVPASGIAAVPVPVRLSVGAATAVPGESASLLIRAAEQNMRDAKGRGQLRVVVDQRGDRTVERAPSLLISEMYRACEANEFELYWQPILSLADGMPVGTEALVRWNHPDRGLLMPGAFLPEAEKDSALMAAVATTLSLQFLRQAFDFSSRHGVGWLAHGYSYNLAAIRLRDPTLVASMMETLAGLGRGSVEGLVQMEVTEGALMDIEHGVPEVLAGIRNLGYRIALDDFGTGHSSLAHLRDFPLNTVKIDKAFVHTIDRSSTDRAVVQAVADIASTSGLAVVAEGVETPIQRDLLLAIKPDILGQGWLYAKAMPVAEFEAWVLGRKQAAVI
jgi:diguanylate cyclase (GGDEF)-like protein